MNIKINKLSLIATLRTVTLIIGILFSIISLGQTNKPATDYLKVPGPIVFNKSTYKLSWSSHPSAAYYKQEYLPAGNTANSFKKMILLEVLAGDSKPADLVNAKIAELKILKETNPVVNYETFQKNGEYMLDFLISENASDGKINILERNVYRYKSGVDKTGKKYVMLFGVSERSYGSESDSFLNALKKTRSVLTNAVATFLIPKITL